MPNSIIQLKENVFASKNMGSIRLQRSALELKFKETYRLT
jgi:hypothetical protein